MLTRSPYNKNNGKPLGQGKEIVATRSGSFYGLRFERIKIESSSYKRGIVVSPNFYFYDSGTKAMIDFSDYKNVVGMEDIEAFFKLNLSGETMTVTQGEWVNPQLTDEKISLSGTYTFNEFKNNMLFVDVVSVEGYDSNLTRYDKNYFVNTPNFDLTVADSQSNLYFTNIINVFGKNSKNSFSYLGAQIGDYIVISNTPYKYEITNISTDDEGKEIVTVNGTIANEDRTTAITPVFLYSVNQDKTDLTLLSSTKIGKCNVNANGVVICYDNQTEAQCQLRKNSKFSEIASFTEGDYCPVKSDTVKQLSATEKLTIIADQNQKMLSTINSSLGNATNTTRFR
jgi:hypothetical protein